MNTVSLVAALSLGIVVAAPARAEPDLSAERNVYTAIFAVKFPCKAAGGERDVVLFETGDPRFARLRPLLGTIFQPYPPPPGLPVEKASVIARGRLPYESAVGPSRPLEAWYFVPESFGRAPYKFEATSGLPAFAEALAVLDEILTDPANVAGVERNETVRTMTAALVDKAAVLVAQGRLSEAAAVLKPKVGRDAGGKEAWHWMYRALTRFDYFGSPGTATEKAIFVSASGKPAKIGPLLLTPAALLPQPFLRHRWDVMETAPVSTVPGGGELWPGPWDDGSRHVLWTVVRNTSFLQYQQAADLQLGAQLHLRDPKRPAARTSVATASGDAHPSVDGAPLLAIAIENTGENSVPLGNVSWALIIDGKAGPTHGRLYDEPDQKKAIGVTDVAFSMKPGFTYQMYVDGPSMTDLGRLDSFTVRIFDLPQQLGPDGSVTRRGYVDVPFKVERATRDVTLRRSMMQSPMVCSADYTARPMVNVPALRAPVYSRWERVEPPPAPALAPEPVVQPSPVPASAAKPRPAAKPKP